MRRGEGAGEESTPTTSSPELTLPSTLPPSSPAKRINKKKIKNYRTCKQHPQDKFQPEVSSQIVVVAKLKETTKYTGEKTIGETVSPVPLIYFL